MNIQLIQQFLNIFLIIIGFYLCVITTKHYIQQKRNLRELEEKSRQNKENFDYSLNERTKQ